MNVAAVDKDCAARLDQKMSMLLATAASAGVHIRLISQGPTNESFPITQRANLTQRTAFRMETAQH